MNKHQISKLLFITSDLVAGIMAWTLFYTYRKSIEVGGENIDLALNDPRFIQALLIIPISWCLGFMLVGSYRYALYKTILGSFQEVIFVISIGSIMLLLFVLNDDVIIQTSSYVKSFSNLLSVHLACFLILRLFLLLLIKNLIWCDVWPLEVFHIGSLSNQKVERGHHIVGSLPTVEDYRSHHSSYKTDLITIDGKEVKDIDAALPMLLGRYQGYAICLHENLLQSVKHDYKGVPSLNSDYVKIFVDPLTSWQYAIKRTGDIVVSILSLVLLSPLFLWIAWRVKRSSTGDIIYKQDRLGLHGGGFVIYKFRSMYSSSEDEGPLLASREDHRCTPIGRWLRRWRLDELPQFINVLKGEMSIVGPRPERKYYADQLITMAAPYPLLWRAKPGITSWGQIKYGYASTVTEMLTRFRYDLLYMDRMGPLHDLRVIWYTIIVLIQGKGR